jgi:hypothetical protein
MTPAQTYDSMTDAELIEFVRERRPGLLSRVEYKPRCWMIREFVIRELERRPMFSGSQQREAF